MRIAVIGACFDRKKYSERYVGISQAFEIVVRWIKNGLFENKHRPYPGFLKPIFFLYSGKCLYSFLKCYFCEKIDNVILLFRGIKKKVKFHIKNLSLNKYWKQNSVWPGLPSKMLRLELKQGDNFPFTGPYVT